MNGKKVVKKCKYTDPYKIKEPKVKKDGYIFNGWYLKEDGSEMNNNYLDNLNGKDAIVYASWVDADLVPPVKAVIFGNDSMNVVYPENDYKAGEKQNIYLDWYYIGGYETLDFNELLVWSTDNPNIIEFDKEGNCFAKKYGDATVTLASKADKSIKAECKVHVTSEYKFNKEPLSMTVDKKEINLEIGEYDALKCDVTGAEYWLDYRYSEEDLLVDGHYVSENDIAKVRQVGNRFVIDANGNGKFHFFIDLYSRKTKEVVSSEEITVVVGTGDIADNDYEEDEDDDWYYEYDGQLAVPGNDIGIKGIYYQVISADKGTGTVGVCGYSQNKIKSGIISIPDTVKVNGYKYKVTEIFSYSFYQEKKLKKVTIGKNIKIIGKGAFENTKNLKTINIKSTKLTSKSVKKNAFKKTNSKATIYVPKSKLKSYKKLLRSRGIGKKVKFKKLK